MSRKMSKFTLACAALVVATSWSVPASAEYPEKSVDFIMPWPPGDVDDVLLRMITDEFQDTYGVPAAVVNKPGGGGGPFPGAIDVARAPADGYTVGSFVIGVPLLGHLIDIPDLTPERFDPIGVVLTFPFVLATSKDAPYQTLEELAEYARDDDVALAHYGEPLIPTKVTMLHAKLAGFEYASDAAYDTLDCNTLASGDADVINTTMQFLIACLDDVTVLSSFTDERNPIVPDAPTMIETDPALSMTLWSGLFVRKETPQDVRDKLAAVIEKVVTGDRAKALAAQAGTGIYWLDAAASETLMAEDLAAFEAMNGMLEE